MQHEAFTPHPAVDSTLHELLVRVKSTLGERFFGLYLYGSLVTGDFDPERSDIDFVVVTHGELPAQMVEMLAAMHIELFASGLPLLQKLEGTYIPLQALRIHNPDDPPRPTMNEGRFYLARQGSDWVIQRWVLRENQSAIVGPSLVTYIDPVTEADLRLAVWAVLKDWWAPMLVDPTRLDSPGYQPYAVLSICRAIHTLAHGTIVSKEAAGRWASDTVDRRWAGLIEAALVWRHGDRPGSLDDTLAFIRYGVIQSELQRAKRDSHP